MIALLLLAWIFTIVLSYFGAKAVLGKINLLE